MVTPAAEVRVSIITPTLNAERYLAECLASVHAQGSALMEHVVIDGGSSDGTEELVRASTAVWLARPGLRQSAAINTGLRVARGDVVAWLNADDVYAHGTLAYVAQRFAAEPDLDVLLGDCDVIDASGRLLWRMTPGPYDFRRLLQRGNSVAQPSVFLRKDVFERVGYLDETLDYGMDYELWLRLRDLRVDYAPRVLAAFRWHTDSKTANNLAANWRELLKIVRRHGGNWTPALAGSYARARFTFVRQRMAGGVRRLRRTLASA